MIQENENKELIKAKTTVFQLLRFRPRSEFELRQKLAAKNIPEETIEKTIQYFKQIQIIDDHQFAKSWINSRLNRNKPYGLNRIKIELKAKGIDDTIFKTTAQNATADYDEVAVIFKLAQRRLVTYKRVDRLKARRRLFEYLVRRGFNTANIHKALRKLFGANDESQ